MKIASGPTILPGGNVGCTQRKRAHSRWPSRRTGGPTPPQVTVVGSIRTVLPATVIRRPAIRRITVEWAHVVTGPAAAWAGLRLGLGFGFAGRFLGAPSPPQAPAPSS